MSRKKNNKQEQVNAIDDLVKRVGSYRTGPELDALYRFIKKLNFLTYRNLL